MAIEVKYRSIPEVNNNLEDLHPLLKNIYLSRGIHSKLQIEKKLENLYPFDLLQNISAATDLIYKHLIKNNKILIVGDFDGDGATSTALAVDFFRKIGACISYLVPDRFNYGYGLSVALVDAAKKYNPALLITVDSGISCFDGTARAKQHGFDVLITDHHLQGEKLPDADVIVNPNLNTDKFPSKNLAGVGVIFYVLLALRAKLREENWFVLNNKPEINMSQFLDLVALGTVTDLVPLDYNNRILVDYGLNRIRSGLGRVGINALLKIAKRNHKNITASDLGYSIGPRLNAAGRLDDMSLGIECLLANDPITALRMAENLDALNQERKLIERDMKAEAIAIINKLNFDNNALPVAFCLYNPDWHQGVIGIVASRIKELYHRPVVVFTEDNEEYIKASCRSIESVHIRDVLQNIANNHPLLIVKFGGHAMAAGLSIKKDNFELFKNAFIQEVEKLITIESIKGIYYIDANLQDKDFNLELAAVIKNAEPWGQQFPEPSFYNQFIVVSQRKIADCHMAFKLKLDVGNSDNREYIEDIEAIVFNSDDKIWFDKPLSKINIVYKLDINEFNNSKKLQLLIDYLEPVP